MQHVCSTWSSTLQQDGLEMNPTRRSRIDRAREAFNASLPREGRVMRQIRRCFVVADGRPLCVGDLLPRVYPHLDRYKHWHRWSCRRALLRYAVPVGRADAQGRPIIWAPKPELMRLITGAIPN